MNALIPRAEAAQSCDPNSESVFRKIANSSATLLKGVGKCAKAAWDGFYGSVIGDTLSIFNGSFWTSSVELYGVVRKVMNDVAAEVASRYQGLNEKPELLMKFMCETVGGILGGTAVTLVTAGAAGAYSGAMRVAKIIEGLNKLLEKSDFVRSNVGRISTASTYSKQYVDCQCSNAAPLPLAASSISSQDGAPTSRSTESKTDDHRSGAGSR